MSYKSNFHQHPILLARSCEFQAWTDCLLKHSGSDNLVKEVGLGLGV